jgi:hypothetical protein
MEAKEVSSFYFFITTESDKKESYWCIIGSAQLPDMTSRRWGNQIRKFLNKNNVFLIGKNKPFIPQSTNVGIPRLLTKKQKTDILFLMTPCPLCSNRAAPWDWNFDRTTFIIDKDSIFNPENKCLSVAGSIVETHKAKKTALDSGVLFIGERITGPGSYYFFDGKAYLAERESDVLKVTNDSKSSNIFDAGRKRIPDDIQMFVWNRDDGHCVKCGTNENLAFDHIIPHSLGGSDSKRNLQILCDRCNRKKGKKIGG